jgi:hypothetical protein
MSSSNTPQSKRARRQDLRRLKQRESEVENVRADRKDVAKTNQAQKRSYAELLTTNEQTEAEIQSLEEGISALEQAPPLASLKKILARSKRQRGGVEANLSECVGQSSDMEDLVGRLTSLRRTIFDDIHLSPDIKAHAQAKVSEALSGVAHVKSIGRTFSIGAIAGGNLGRGGGRRRGRASGGSAGRGRGRSSGRRGSRRGRASGGSAGRGRGRSSGGRGSRRGRASGGSAGRGRGRASRSSVGGSDEPKEKEKRTGTGLWLKVSGFTGEEKDLKTFFSVNGQVHDVRYQQVGLKDQTFVNFYDKEDYEKVLLNTDALPQGMQITVSDGRITRRDLTLLDCDGDPDDFSFYENTAWQVVEFLNRQFVERKPQQESYRRNVTDLAVMLQRHREKMNIKRILFCCLKKDWVGASEELTVQKGKVMVEEYLRIQDNYFRGCLALEANQNKRVTKRSDSTYAVSVPKRLAREVVKMVIRAGKTKAEEVVTIMEIIPENEQIIPRSSA